MTTEEQKEQERKQKEWVKARINCTIQAVLACLVRSLRYDVNLYNESGLNTEFKVADIEGNDGVIIQDTAPREYTEDDYVTVKLQKSCIHVSRNEKKLFTVTPQWDENALECKLLVNDAETPLTYPQISQKAIGALLFKPPIYPRAL